LELSIINLNKKISNSAKIYWLLALTTIIPLCFSLIYQTQREEDFVFVFINAAILFFPLYFFKGHKLYLCLIFPFLLIPAFFDFVHVFLYQGRITESIFFIIFDTNPMESAEYIESNLTWQLLTSSFIYLACTIGLFIKVLRIPKINISMKWSKFLALWLILPFCIKLGTSKGDLDKTLEAYRRSSHAYSFVHNFVRYKKQIERFKSFSQTMKTDLKVSRSRNIIEDEVHLLVIGESTTSTHMGIYDYHRNTTPELEKMKKDLHIFKDVMSSNPPGTMANLKKILTLANSEKEDSKLLSVNIVNVMKAAGFKTYWVSNQLILGQHDTTTTVFAKQADRTTFTNTTNSTTFDEKVFPVLDDYLVDEPKKKFIVVHLFGTHMQYEHRSPKDFKKFTETADIPKRSFHNKRKLGYINDYDNAILYHDFILSKLIKKVKAHGKVSTITYLSDHGEEVYDLKNVHGHPSGMRTMNMFKIPMFIWTSRTKNFANSLNNKYVSDDIIHTLFDLYELNLESYIKHKSILHDTFIEKDRFIGTKKI
jgi:heptose-I-phosphate ethanolaminephosphotransferase